MFKEKIFTNLDEFLDFLEYKLTKCYYDHFKQLKIFQFYGSCRGTSDDFPKVIGEYRVVDCHYQYFYKGKDMVIDENGIEWKKIYEHFTKGDAYSPSYYTAIYVNGISFLPLEKVENDK